MINLEQINSLMGKLEFSQNFCAILISLAFPPPLISCERDAVKSFKCKCHFSTGKQMEKLDLESKWIKVFPIHIHNGEEWLKTTGALLTMDWRWSCIPFSLEMKRLRKIWLLSFHSSGLRLLLKIGGNRSFSFLSTKQVSPHLPPLVLSCPRKSQVSDVSKADKNNPCLALIPS